MLATHYTPRNSYILYTFHEKTVVTLKSWINIFKKIRALSSFAAKKAVQSCCEHLFYYSDSSSNKYSIRIFARSALQKSSVDFLLVSEIKLGFSKLCMTHTHTKNGTGKIYNLKVSHLQRQFYFFFKERVSSWQRMT